MSKVSDMLLPKNVEQTAEVTELDQKYISSFSRFHMEYRELKEVVANLSKQIEDIESAGTQLMDMDDDEAIALYKVGTGYIEGDGMALEEKADAKKEELSKKLEETNKKIFDLTTKMDHLKILLKNKFKDSINLEYHEF